MKLNRLKRVSTLMSLVLLLATGCVATKSKNIQLKKAVVDTLPQEVAIKYLRSLPREDISPCRFSNRGLAGSVRSGYSFKTTGYQPYAEWRITAIGHFENPTNSGLLINLRRGGVNESTGSAWMKNLGGGGGQQGCVAYLRRHVTLNPEYEEEIHKAVSALVSLGVKYDPNAEWSW